MIDPNCRKLRHGVAAGAAIALVATMTRLASAQTPPPPGRGLQIELDSPPGVVVKIRPYLGSERPAEFLTCPPSCRLTGYAGLYQIEADPPIDSPLRRLRKTVELLDDSRVFVEPGERADRHWGVGLTVSGGILLGLGTLVALFTNALDGDIEDESMIAALSTMATGAGATTGGIYLLVRSRGRVTTEPVWQPPVAPLPSPSGARLHMGWRF